MSTRLHASLFQGLHQSPLYAIPESGFLLTNASTDNVVLDSAVHLYPILLSYSGVFLRHAQQKCCSLSLVMMKVPLGFHHTRAELQHVAAVVVV